MKRHLKKRITAFIMCFVMCCSTLLGGLPTAMTVHAEEGDNVFSGRIIPKEHFESFTGGKGWGDMGEELPQAEGTSFQECLANLKTLDAEGEATGYYWIDVVGEMNGKEDIVVLGDGSINEIFISNRDDWSLKTNKIETNIPLYFSGSLENDGDEITVSTGEDGSLSLVNYHRETSIGGILNGANESGEPSGTIYLTEGVQMDGIKGIKQTTFLGNWIYITSGEQVEFYDVTLNGNLDLNIGSYDESNLPVFHEGTIERWVQDYVWFNMGQDDEEQSDWQRFEVYIVWDEDAPEGEDPAHRYIKIEDDFYGYEWIPNDEGGVDVLSNEPTSGINPELHRYDAKINIRFENKELNVGDKAACLPDAATQPLQCLRWMKAVCGDDKPLDRYGCVLDESTEYTFRIQRFIGGDNADSISESYANWGVNENCYMTHVADVTDTSELMWYLETDASELDNSDEQAYYLIEIMKDLNESIDLTLPSAVKGVKMTSWGKEKENEDDPDEQCFVSALSYAKVVEDQELVLFGVTTEDDSPFLLEGDGTVKFINSTICQPIVGAEGNSITLGLRDTNKISSLQNLNLSFLGEGNELLVTNPGELEFASINIDENQIKDSNIRIVMQGYDDQNLPTFNNAFATPEITKTVWIKADGDEEHAEAYPVYYDADRPEQEYVKIDGNYYTFDWGTNEQGDMLENSESVNLMSAMDKVRIQLRFLNDITVREDDEKWNDNVIILDNNDKVVTMPKSTTDAYKILGGLFYDAWEQQASVDIDGTIVYEDEASYQLERFAAGENQTAQQSYLYRGEYWGEDEKESYSDYISKSNNLENIMAIIEGDIAVGELSKEDAYYMLGVCKPDDQAHKLSLPEGLTALKVESWNRHEMAEENINPEDEAAEGVLKESYFACSEVTMKEGQELALMHAVLKSEETFEIVGSGDVRFINSRIGQPVVAEEDIVIHFSSGDSTVKELDANEVHLKQVFLTVGEMLSVSNLTLDYNDNVNDGNSSILAKENAVLKLGNVNTIYNTEEEDNKLGSELNIYLEESENKKGTVQFWGNLNLGRAKHENPQEGEDTHFDQVVRIRQYDCSELELQNEDGIYSSEYMVDHDYMESNLKTYYDGEEEMFQAYITPNSNRNFEVDLVRMVFAENDRELVFVDEDSESADDRKVYGFYWDAEKEEDVKTQKYAAIFHVGGALEDTVISIPEQSYTYMGQEIKPVVTVTKGNMTLTKDRDYEVAYSNHTNAGTATITVTGKGYYTGSNTKTFTISPKSVSGVSVSGMNHTTYTGAAITQTVVVKDGSVTLSNGSDYNITYKDNTNAGNATVTITGKGNYSGTVNKSFTILAKSITGLTIHGVNDMNYTGEALMQSGLKVMNGSALLVLDRDYTVSYKNNTDAGTAEIIITGKGNYTGNISKSFNIHINKGSQYTVNGIKYKVTAGTAQGGNVIAVGAGNKNAKSVKIPDTVKIGGITFKVTEIGSGAYKGMTKLTKITMGKNVTKIGKGAFSNCKVLTSVTIGASVTTIGDQTFKGCVKMTRITIPAKVTTLGKEVFSGASKLKTITVKASKLKKVGKNCFKGIQKKATIKVPKAKLSAYQKLFKGKGQASTVKIKK